MPLVHTEEISIWVVESGQRDPRAVSFLGRGVGGRGQEDSAADDVAWCWHVRMLASCQAQIGLKPSGANGGHNERLPCGVRTCCSASRTAPAGLACARGLGRIAEDAER